MNPYGVTRPHLDLAAISAWTAANEQARREYYLAPTGMERSEPRTCPCGVDLAPRRRLCDTCRTSVRRARSRNAQRRTS